MVGVDKKVKDSEYPYEELYNLVMETAIDGFLHVDDEGNILEVNKAYCRISGYSREELLNMQIADLDAKENSEQIADHIQQVKIKGKDRFETHHRTKDGRIIDIEISAVYSGQKVPGIFAFLRDITEYNHAFEELRASEEKFRLLYDNAPLAYQSLDENGCFIDVNPAWLKTLGYEREEVIGNAFSNFLHDEWKPHFEKNFPEFKRRGYVHDVQFRMKHKGGYHIYVSFEGCIGYNSDGSFRQTYCVFKDITERVLVEEELRKSEEKFRLLVTQMQQGMAVHEVIRDNSGKVVDYRFLDVNRSYERLTGLKRENIVGKTVLEVLPDTESYWIENYGNVATEGDPLHYVNYSRELGKYFDVVAYQTLPGQFATIVSDITESRRADIMLRQQLARNKAIINTMPDRLFVIDRDGYFREYYANNHSYFALSPEKIVGSNVRDMFDEKESIRHIQTYRKCIECGSLQILEYQLELEGKKAFFEARVSPLDDDSVLAIVRDITESKRSEEALLYARAAADESNRMKNEILKNVTHELRTPLTAVIGFSDLLLNDLGENSCNEQKEYLKYIHESGKKLSDIVDRMLEFSNAENGNLNSLNLTSFNIREVLFEILNLLASKAVKKNIDLSSSIDHERKDIIADREKIREILFNLVENAIKFTDIGGSVNIEIKYNNKDIRFSVNDTGIGIDKNRIMSIFEPFIQVDGSISRRYDGTGLGLALVRKLVEMHEGHIWVESEPGKGSNFTFSIPKHQIKRDGTCLNV